MATTNLDSADLKGVNFGGMINESVMQRIWDISNIPLPFTDMIGSGSIDNEFHEWVQDSLPTPSLTNAVVDGADISQNDTSRGRRIGNHSQISVKEVQVSTRARASNTIGTADELAYQVVKAQRALRRDVEAMMLDEQAAVADDGNSTAGRSAGLPNFIEDNVNRGAGGALAAMSGSGPGAVTPGTTRALTEKQIRDVVQSAYENGGNPSVLMSIPTVIANISKYLMSGTNRGFANIQDQIADGTRAAFATGSVQAFSTDFGVLYLTPNRLMQAENAAASNERANVFILDPDYIEQVFLKGYAVEPLAKTGLSDKRMMNVDWSLRVTEQKAQGLISDIDYTAAVTA